MLVDSFNRVIDYITGGEPLLRKGLDEFIAKLHAYNKEVALVLSTNGFLLKKWLRV